MKKPIIIIPVFISLVLIAGVFLLDKATVRRPPYTIACGMEPDSSKNGYTWVCHVIEEDGTVRSFRGGSPDINPTVKWEDGVVDERSTHTVE